VPLGEMIFRLFIISLVRLRSATEGQDCAPWSSLVVRRSIMPRKLRWFIDSMFGYRVLLRSSPAPPRDLRGLAKD
jgi:hypothetical protein